jgi:hypothetical protein
MSLQDDADVRGEIAALQQAVAALTRKLIDSPHSLSRGMAGDDRLDPHKIVVADDLRQFGWKPRQLRETK